MRWQAWVVAAGLVVALGACATTRVNVPVAGDASTLAGRWEGEFRSTDGRRTGSILFDLRAGRDSAYGDVLLIPAELQRQNPQGRDGAHVSPELIGIRFVFVRAGVVRGTLEPYRDPICGCRTQTVFNGTLDGAIIEGTYRAYHVETREVHEGSWLVRRSAAYTDTSIHGNDVVRKPE